MTASIAAQVPSMASWHATVVSRRGVRLASLSSLALILAFLAGGCGKSEPARTSSASPPPPPAQPVAEAPKTVEENPPAATSPALSEEPVEEKPLPQSAIDWTPADYRRAKEDRDPRLIDAVAFLAREGVQDEQTAQLLVELLTTTESPLPEPKPQPKPVKPAKPEPEQYEERHNYEDDNYAPTQPIQTSPSEEEEGRYRYEDDLIPARQNNASLPRRAEAAPLANVAILKPAYVSLVGSIVHALGVNQTDFARKSIEQLLSGTLVAGNDRLATSAALKVLADNPCAENDATLLRVLTQPEAFRPAGRGKVTAEQLRESAFGLIVKTATPEMRLRLAQYLLSPNPSAVLRERLMTFLMTSHPYNVTPQLAVYARPNTGHEIKREFEVFFTTYSSSALARLLAISTPPPASETMSRVPMATPAAAEPNQPWVAFGSKTAAPGATASPAAASTVPDEHYGNMEDDYGYEEESYSGRPAGRPAAHAAASRRADGWGAGGGRVEDMESAKAFDQVVQADSTLPQYLAVELWSTQFSAQIAAALDSISSLENAAQLVNLATTIPTDTSRTALCKTLHAHWEEGPQGLFKAHALPEAGTIDPGFLAVVKTLPRRMPAKAKTPTRSRVSSNSNSGDEYGDGEDGYAPAAEVAKEKGTPEHEWFDASQTLVRYLCERFYEAAQAQAGAGTPSGGAGEDASLKIPQDADVVASYRLDWQQDVGGKLSGAEVDPLVIRYVRFQVNKRYSRMIGRYRRAVPGGEICDVDTGTWIDGYHAGSDASRRRSVDVLIHRTRGDSAGSTAEPSTSRVEKDEPLEVEILSIEITDPNRS